MNSPFVQEMLDRLDLDPDFPFWYHWYPTWTNIRNLPEIEHPLGLE